MTRKGEDSEMMKDRRWIKVLAGIFLIALMISICAVGLGELDWFFKEHLSITPWAYIVTFPNN